MNPQFHFPHPAPGTIALTAKGQSLLKTPPEDFAKHGAVFCINQSVLYVPRKYVTALCFKDKHRYPECWLGHPPPPEGMPIVEYNDVAAHAIKIQMIGWNSVISLAQLIHFYPGQQLHLYGFDYEEAPDAITNSRFDTRRLEPELTALASVWLPAKDRITNHGKLTAERLEEFQ